MKKTYFFALLVLLIFAVSVAYAQVEPAAYVRTRSVDIGITTSAFQPNYIDNSSSQTNANGAGVYVDARLMRRMQLEAEGRWLESTQPVKLQQTNLLIGPRTQIYRASNTSVYGKVLLGMSDVHFSTSDDKYGYFAIAGGGGVDIRLNRKFILRLVDFEYMQLLGGYQYPNERTHQYGVSAGVAYRFFGRRY